MVVTNLNPIVIPKQAPHRRFHGSILIYSVPGGKAHLTLKSVGL